MKRIRLSTLMLLVVVVALVLAVVVHGRRRARRAAWVQALQERWEADAKPPAPSVP